MAAHVRTACHAAYRALPDRLAEAGVAIVGLWRRPFAPVVRDLAGHDRGWLAEIATAACGLPVITVSGVHDPVGLPGLVAEHDGERLGALTYRVGAGGIEVVTLNSLAEGRGIGSALLAGAQQVARLAGQRLWLIAGNENIRAIGCYQRRGMDMVALHRHFADQVRRVKPAVPGAAHAGITYRHAIEFEYPAPAAG
ncbi:MAG TPA: GNAT family N-acetyltransferase [Streptosporangiaceae bacterium]|nr:GNAT family N-acetyltransferase [Streptosporangiaceae bacterium]